MTISRLLLILFLFLVPYWGIFYFRFGISNGYIIVNVVFVFLAWILDNALGARREAALE
jgi:uncharacterized membrane protein YqaE (UPF0057 family)